LAPTDTTSAGHHARLLVSSDVVDAFVHARNHLGGVVANRLAMSPLSILGKPPHPIRNELLPFLARNNLDLRRSGQLLWAQRRPVFTWYREPADEQLTCRASASNNLKGSVGHIRYENGALIIMQFAR